MVKDLLNKRTLLLSLLFFFAFFLRLSLISKGPFHYDTLDFALASQKTLDTFILHYKHSPGYPLTVITGALFIFIFRLFGEAQPVFCVNFMSVCMGALGVLLLFFLVEKLFDFHRAIFSAILFAFFGPYVAISTFGKSLTFGISLSLASAYFMLRYTEGEKNRDLVYSAIFLGLCAAARPSDTLVALPIAFLFFSRGRINYSKVKPFVVFCFLSVLTAVIYYIPMFLDKGIGELFASLNDRHQAALLGLFSPVFKASLGWFVDSFMWGGVLLFLAGFVFMARQRKIRELSFLVIWFLVFHFFYASVASAGVRYMVIAWIPLIVAQGFFMGGVKGKNFYLAFFMLVIFAIVSFVGFYPALEFRHRRALQVEFAQWVSQKTTPQAIIIALDEGIFLEHYGGRRVISRPITCEPSRMEAFFDETVDKLLEKDTKVYYITTSFVSYDFCDIFKNSVFERYDIEIIGEKENEDWHHALLNQVLFLERLYRINKKSSA